jgi:MoaA/NifB/PqqE/SkfB family radical SAM enzyme
MNKAPGIEFLKQQQVFWDTAGMLAKYYPRGHLREIPKSIIIEPGNPCNLRCPVCPTHFAMKRKRGFMDPELFKSIIDDLDKTGKKHNILMNFAGEPLLNRKIVELVAYANKKGHFIFISTNMTMMTEKLSEELIKAGLSSIHLCMDGFSKESQEGYRRGSNFEQVKKNIENFLAIKKKLKSETPFCSIQTLLTSYSEDEMDEIVEWAKEHGANEVNFKSLSMGSYTSESMKEKYGYLLPKKEELRRNQVGVQRTICPVPMDQALIYWNGDLGLCCVDFDNVIKLKNIKEKGFVDTFLSPEMVEARRKGFMKKYSLCKNCSLGNAEFMGYEINLDKLREKAEA